MPKKSSNFKLEYLQRGSYYSNSLDYRRFVSLDYNLESYVGVIGVGIIDGWTIQQVSGLQVRILPGDGIINGFYGESPYVIKQRSLMVAGDREIEVMPDLLPPDNTQITPQPAPPQPNLTAAERAIYVSVIQLYDPTYNPTGNIENAYVKVVVPTILTLSNNADNYVYAQLLHPAPARYCPVVTDLTTMINNLGSPPNRNNYTTYDDYKAALDIYDVKLQQIYDYNWQDNTANHFTEVQFLSSTSFVKTSSKVLLGRVVTRSSTVITIDTSMVDTVKNLNSEIKRYATELLVEHKHGGNKPYDPPKIRLETDIRETALMEFNETTGKARFNVLEKNYTTTTIGHKHTYKIDADGNGYTIDTLGTTVIHFHVITEFIMGNQQPTPYAIDDHIHEIKTAEQQGDTWDSDSQYYIYVNDVIVADETSTTITTNSDTKEILFDKGISTSYSEYSTSFPIFGETYTYTSQSVSMYRFMLEMISDFWNKYADKFEAQGNRDGDPFTFYSDTEQTQIVGTAQLQSQSEAAQYLLKESGDQFTFTPQAAQNITVILNKKGNIDDVRIEILGNSEVTGILGTDNIVFVNANKILTGELEIGVIPFISHIGRFRESFYPLQYNIVSNDGVRYTVSPTITDVKLGHYHKLLLNVGGDGSTSDVLIGEEVIYYGPGTSTQYLITHYHAVNNNVLSNSQSQGLMDWQNDLNSSNVTSSTHTHEIINVLPNNSKTVYSIKEDEDGTLYAGTSEGFMMIPGTSAYMFVINGYKIFAQGSNLWSVFIEAKAQYEVETGISVYMGNDYYVEPITDAVDSLVSDGDSVLIEGPNVPDRTQDIIMIKKISSFKVPNFKYEKTKNEFEVLSTETVIEEADSEGDVTVERNFNGIPVWSIGLKQQAQGTDTITNVVVVGSNLIAKNKDLSNDPYFEWESPNIPFQVGITRKIIKTYAGEYWICTNNGILVSRDHSNGDLFEATNIPGGNPDIKDILEGDRDIIYVASSSGIFKTIDGGKNWTKIYDVIGGFNQIVRDNTLDLSSVVTGHYHGVVLDIDGNGLLSASIGTGPSHTHTVVNGVVSTTLAHTHTLVTTLYAIDNDKIIWKSIDSGTSWIQYGSITSGEYGLVFAGFGYLFVAKYDGLYSISVQNGDWTKVLDKKVYSFNWNYDITAIMLGCENLIYSTYDGLIFGVVYDFDGDSSPVVLEGDDKKYFGYAYSNESQTFNFYDVLVTSDNVSALIDYRKWYADEGAWEDTSPYDIYIENKLVLSTKTNQDNREAKDYYFDVIPTNGLLDFDISTGTTSKIEIYDKYIEVADGTGFAAGDEIFVQSVANTAANTVSASMYATIDSADANNLYLKSRADTEFDSATVYKIPKLNMDSSIVGNIYDGLLINIGTNTHDQIEDGLSNYSDGRPYKFNDTYLSNLLQITQAVRYAYPAINDYFINSLFYDFRYSFNPLDPIYPYIYDYIDILTTEIYNQKVYDSKWVGLGARSINTILVGYGLFAGKVFVGTDIGVFWTQTTNAYENNWNYLYALPYAVYDLMIYQNRLMAATANGTYWTSYLLSTWTLEDAGSILFPSYALNLRWKEQTTVNVASHSAEFISELGSNNGRILSDSGAPYAYLSENQGVKIFIDGVPSGGYIIEEIQDIGYGFGSGLVVSPKFNFADGHQSLVTMVMGDWWGQWSGDTNQSNADLTNTLMVGGEDRISYNDGGSTWYWRESLNEISDFNAKKFLTLSNGRTLSATVGNNSVTQENHIIKSDDIGKNWQIFKNLSEISGSVLSCDVTDYDNTKIEVSYTVPENFVYMDGILNELDISFYQSNATASSYNGKIVWNENRNGKDTITIFGNSAYNLISGNNFSFKVAPHKVNSMVESSENTLFFGTNKGLYNDFNTSVSNSKPRGSILNVGKNGVVSVIDISGTIANSEQSSSSSNTVFNVTTDVIIKPGELDGKSIYITDTDPVQKYTVVSNKASKLEDQSVIEINTYLPSTYNGKRFVVVGESSRVYIDYSLPVVNGEFNGGKLYVTSDENLNYGTVYDIVDSKDNYVNLKTAIIPTSTLYGSEVGTNKDLQTGQTVRLVDATGDLVFWCNFDKQIKQNSLCGLTMVISGDTSDEDLTIKSNTGNSLTISVKNPLLFNPGYPFEIAGLIYDVLPGFGCKKTSTDSDHYHNVFVVGASVSGKIGSFGTHNDAYVDINVSDTVNFSNPIVQFQTDLFENAEIVFTNDESYNLRIVSEVVSNNATQIRVRLKSASYWDFMAYDEEKISVNWRWSIDASNYGYTGGNSYSDSGTFYDDFVVISSKVTSDLTRTSNIIELEDSTGIFVGDKIRIQDDTLSYQITHVSQVIDATHISSTDSFDKVFYKKNNTQIKVLRDNFANTHRHQIRKNEIQLIGISAYLNNGYPFEHSHRTLPLIEDISSLLIKSNGDILAMGNSNKVYVSNNNGVSWSEYGDLNNYIENGDEVDGISVATLYNNKVLAGATNGFVFVEK